MINKTLCSEITALTIILGLSCFMPTTKALADVTPAPLPTGIVQRIAFGSCAKHWQPQPIWDAVIEQDPDLWLFLGDNIYADTDGSTAWLISKGQLIGEWNRLADKPEFQVKEASKEVFLTFWNEPKASPRWKRSGIYDAKIFGPKGKRDQIILLDTKYNRSTFKPDPMPKAKRLKAGKVGGYIPDTHPAKTHLGEEQWAWLEEELKKAAEVRLLASSTQVIPNQKGMDEWGNFPLERQRLFDLIKKTKANGVVLLSGNVHFAEISKLEDGSLFELTSIGMTHVNESYANAVNKYRVAGPSTDLNFGMVEIDWQEQASPRITLKAINNDGKTVISYQLNMGEQKQTVCTDPRPQVCTMDYRPVCAQLEDGNSKIYANGCTACSDQLVTAYVEGVCR